MIDRTKQLYALLAIVIPLVAVCHADTLLPDGAAFMPLPLNVGSGEKALAAADFDGDGHVDLAVTDWSLRDVAVLTGDGTGQFREVGRFPAGENPTHVTATDFDADGKIDLVIANHETTYLTLLRGDGLGSFWPTRESPLEIGVDPHPHVVKVSDLDADGHPDLVVDHRTGGGLLILRGLGKGQFETPGTLVSMGGDPYLGMVIGDVNDDGWSDLITPNTDEVGIALRTKSGRVAFERVTPLKTASPFAVALADINADGRVDIIAASERAAGISVFAGEGNGDFRPDKPTQLMAQGAKSIGVGDFNADGIDDVIVIGWSAGAIILLGQNDSPVPVSFPLDAIENPWGLALGDFNEDGHDDFVIADGIRPIARIYVSRNRSDE
ncbi:MAG: VCBS repeat-containing protein [Gammaproteobacteria bacterium]|nr:VCBS repeat-containing protein [Gammaproteobacteria bacterium]MDH3374764.1 VCBS repeat-containing protein [Gammaproteobacteria bacterium]MDH3410730.1 VCBS repeat-containing protein [Gammaproteobacteria bacterium]MDH3552610.1 VCBS repeat-containing protein [Gammaproteobacteria bacterium]